MNATTIHQTLCQPDSLVEHILKGSGMGTVDGGGTLAVKGGMVKIN